MLITTGPNNIGYDSYEVRVDGGSIRIHSAFEFASSAWRARLISLSRTAPTHSDISSLRMVCEIVGHSSITFGICLRASRGYLNFGNPFDDIQISICEVSGTKLTNAFARTCTHRLISPFCKGSMCYCRDRICGSAHLQTTALATELCSIRFSDVMCEAVACKVVSTHFHRF